MKRTKIDFWGIGAQKCGTTWLYYNLDKLPEFNLPPIKELHYFDRSIKYPSPNFLSESKFNRRLNKGYFKSALRLIILALKKKEINNAKFYLKWHFLNYNDKWYLGLFKNYRGIKGEITPSYSILEKSDIYKMYKMSPDSKLVLMLRNPIDRAWSHFCHVKKRQSNYNIKLDNNEDILNFMDSESQVLRSDYIRTINNFISVFPKKQLLICFYDAIVDDPSGLLKDVISFLGLEKEINIQKSNYKKALNVSIKIECPEEIRSYLKKKYYNQIKQMSGQYGGYFSKWYEDTYDLKSNNPNKTLLKTMQI